MPNMAQGLVYSKRSKGGKVFSGLLQNVSDPAMPTDVPLTNTVSYQVYFRTPSFKVIVRNGAVNETADPSDDMDIFYATTDDDPIIDEETGYWEYTVGITRTNGNVIVSPIWEGFWVIE